jgi:hypothetical protein
MTRKIVSTTTLVAVQVSLMATAAHAAVPVSVPEPTTLSLLGAAAVIAGVGAWWRHRK